MGIGDAMRRALSTIIVIALLGAACGADDATTTTETVAEESTSQESVVVTTTTLPEPTPTARVVEFYNAINAGSVEGMQAAFPTGDPEYFDLLVAVRQRASVACSPGTDVSLVVCNEFVGNDFFDPAGVRGVFTVQYELADGLIVAHELVEAEQPVVDYVSAFGEWLESTDPDLSASSYDPTDSRLPFGNTDGAESVVARVEEFLAQSDVYPLSP